MANDPTVKEKVTHILQNNQKLQDRIKQVETQRGVQSCLDHSHLRAINNLDWFVEIDLATDETVSFGNKSEIPVEGIGRARVVSLSDTALLLSNAYYVPDFVTNLISQDQLYEKGVTITYTLGQFTFFKGGVELFKTERRQRKPFIPYVSWGTGSGPRRNGLIQSTVDRTGEPQRQRRHSQPKGHKTRHHRQHEPHGSKTVSTVKKDQPVALAAGTTSSRKEGVKKQLSAAAKDVAEDGPAAAREVTKGDERPQSLVAGSLGQARHNPHPHIL